MEDRIRYFYSLGIKVFPVTIRMVNGEKKVTTGKWKNINWTKELAIERLNKNHTHLAILTGKDSGIIGADLDDYKNKDDNGFRHRLSFETKDICLPKQVTMRKGIHLLFRRPDGGTYGNKSFEKLGVDLRGDGGLLFTGPGYQWEVPIDEGELVLPPPCIMELYEEDNKKEAEADYIGVKRITSLTDNQLAVLDKLKYTATNCKEGERSEADFALVSWMKRLEMNESDMWDICKGIGKFKTRGKEYFDLTLKNAFDGSDKVEIKDIQQLHDFLAVHHSSMNNVDLIRLKNRMKTDKIATKNDFDDLLKDIITNSQRDLVKKILEKKNLIHTPQHGYMEYNQGIYQPRSQERIDRYIMEEVGERVQGKDLKPINGLLKAECDGTMDDGSDPFNIEEYRKRLLNLKNGMWDIKEKVLFEYSPTPKFTSKLDVEYHAEATCPNWEKFISDILMGDKKMIFYVKQLLGYLFYPYNRDFEAFIMLSGRGSNGKSVMINVLYSMFGDSCAGSVPMNKLDSAFNRYLLYGKYLNVSSESKGTLRDCVEDIKAIASGDKIHGEKKYCDGFTYEAFVKLIFAMNDALDINDRSHGFFRKLHAINFEVTFVEREEEITGPFTKLADKHLQDRLMDEKSGILNWCLDGLQSLLGEGGFCVPEKARLFKKKIQEDNNPAYTFFTEQEYDYGDCYPKSTIYSDYKLWATDNGHGVLSSRQFWNNAENNLSRLGLVVEDQGRRAYDGKMLHSVKISRCKPRGSGLKDKLKDSSSITSN